MKDLVQFLPWIGLVAGLLFLVFGGKRTGERFVWRPAESVVPLLGAALAFGGSFLVYGDVRTALVWFAGVALLGYVLTLVPRFARSDGSGSLFATLGIAAFVVGSGWLAVDSVSKMAGIVIGLTVAAVPSHGRRPLLMALASLVFAGLAYALVARIGYRDEISQGALLVVVCLLLAAALHTALVRALGARMESLARTLALVVLAGLVWLVLSTYLGEGDLALVGVVSIAALLATAWAVPIDRQSVATWGIAAVVWLGMATFAFSLGYGLGMAVAGLLGVGAALLLDRTDLLPPVGIVVGLAVYRLFREGNDEIVQAFDIGQHYAMVGFLLGIVVLVALSDALVRRREKWNAGLEGALIGLVAIVIVVGAGTFFGPKGAIGLFVGLAVAPVVAQLTAVRPPWTLVLSAALQCAVLVTYRQLSWDLELDRSGKFRLLVWLAVAVLVLYAALRWMERPQREVSRDEG